MGVIEKVNEESVPLDLFKNLVELIGDLPEGERSDMEGRTMAMIHFLNAADIEGNHALIMMSVQFRMAALARLRQEPAYRAWSLNAEGSGDYVHEVLVETAATQRLIELEGEPAFEPKSFFRAALELSEAGGRA